MINGSHLATGVTVGPFVHIRPDTELHDSVHIGNFVELKKAVLGKGSKAGHHSYLGDAVIGENVNIGAGTITCNYDGTRKHQTTIEDGVFVGSDSQLVHRSQSEGAYIGSGLPSSERAGRILASAGGKQRNIEGWAERKRQDGKSRK